MAVRFVLDGDVVDLDAVAASDTLLDYLRCTLRRTGSKEGCAEGDCGACTVLVGTLDRDGAGVVWRAVNACILLMPMLHGKALLTVESLGPAGGATALQCDMAANGSSQCGFCTPGFVMSLHGRTIGAVGCGLPVADVLAGNLCRCTGYGPILAAGQAAGPQPRDDGPLAEKLRELAGEETVSGIDWSIPKTGDALAALLAEQPDARLVAGATDVGLWVTKRLDVLKNVIFIGDIADLAAIDETGEALVIGAGVRYADAHDALARLHPDLGELTRRIGGLQVRNAGTVGGNIANGSPIGDGPPALIALGATLVLRSAPGGSPVRRTMPLEAYFLDYGKQDRRPGEFVESVRIPRPGPDDVVQIAKLSRRFDSDISAVLGAFRLTVVNGRITGARIAFGGMAATPCRAPACEAALVGQAFDPDTIARAAQALRTDFSPLTDVRGSADYRLQAAEGLLWRLWHKAQGHAVSVLEVETADG